MIRKTSLLTTIIGFVSCFIIIFQSPIIEAEEVSFGTARAFRDNEGQNTVGTGVGSRFQFGVHSVVPDSNNGTTATASNAVTGDSYTPLPDGDFFGSPAFFGIDMPYNYDSLSPWTITLKNEDDVTVAVTPDRRDTPEMEFVENLAISGVATAPTVTWQLPQTGARVDQVRYQIWDDDTDSIIVRSTLVPGGVTAVSLTLSDLEAGRHYAIRITPIHEDSEGRIAARSSNWISWPVNVVIDIKPGSDPNCLNINSHGVIPVAINGSEDFFVYNIDVDTLFFGGLAVRLRGNRGPLCSIEDWNVDGYSDLVCHFDDDPDAWLQGVGTATLTGSLYNGTPFEGTDSICVVP